MEDVRKGIGTYQELDGDRLRLLLLLGVLGIVGWNMRLTGGSFPRYLTRLMFAQLLFVGSILFLNG
jgi:hypothetical protein